LYLLSIYSYDPCAHTLVRTRPSLSGGDEPHYLIIVSSLLSDGDLSLANNYQSARSGGADAGRQYSGHILDHHTLIQDTRTREIALWDRIFAPGTVECAPGDPSCIGYQRVSLQFPDYTLSSAAYRELPAHAVPFPALIALILRLIRAGPNQVESDAIYTQVFLAWFAGVLTYGCALKAGLGPARSLTSVALVYFASPWLVYSHSLFPATFLGLLLVAALWAFLSRRVVLAAAFLILAGMQSEVYVLIFPAWALFLYFFLKEKNSALRFALSGLGFLIVVALINRFLLGLVSIRYIWFTFAPVLWRTFLEPERGLWVFVPWSIVAFWFLIHAFFRRNLEMAIPLRVMGIGILPAAGVFMMIFNTGGDCFGPRYWVPFLPWLSIALVIGAGHVSRIRPLLTRPILIMLVALSAVVSATGAILSHSVVPFWNKPPWYASRTLFNASRWNNSEVECAIDDLDFWLGHDCTQPPRSKVTVALPAPVKSTALLVVSRLACSSQIPDGTEVARLRVTETDGNVEILSLIAGRDSSEWAYDCPSVNRLMRHQRASIYATYPAKMGGDKFPGHFYSTKYALGGVKEIKAIYIEWLGEPGAIIIDKLILINEEAHRSYPIDSSMFAGVEGAFSK
jgi:hypothetical protein